MSGITKIVWSGLSGKTGTAAIKQADALDDVIIVAGIRRELVGGIDYEGAIDFNSRTGFAGKWYRFRDLNNITRPQPENFDALVDFSDESVFERVVELAVRTHVPLISGTSGLSDRQMAMLYDATNQIPIFHGGIFRFKLKEFADRAIEFAKEHDDLVLTEQHWTGQPLPTEFAKMIGKRFLRETGKTVQVINGAPYAADSYINEWVLYGDNSTENFISCKVQGYDELAHDVLEIAKVMAAKPVKKGEFYNLDEIWDELPH